MESAGGVADVAHTIQLAVAPVFLLSAVGAMLAVLTNRLARIVDRARLLETRLSNVHFDQERVAFDLETLTRRAKLINRAIALSTLCALLICTVVASLFMATLLGVAVGAFIAAVFVLAMVALTGALLFFLGEVYTATRSLRIGQ